MDLELLPVSQEIRPSFTVEDQFPRNIAPGGRVPRNLAPQNGEFPRTFAFLKEMCPTNCHFKITHVKEKINLCLIKNFIRIKN